MSDKPMTHLPPFLLIMPSYNQAHYIASAVDSILQQEDQNWALWIVDNSSDNTPEVMKAYNDARIHFLHIPERMDPGTCLNMILDQEGHQHRDFSYVHTDNLLRADYVTEMRRALEGDVRSVAYCDMKSLDETGRYTGVFRRGPFDLARLFSLLTLGVPFSATTQLARELGGFNKMDVADDVLFCVRAWPRARFIHIPDAIMDYRTHGDSRTTSHGGAWHIERSFLTAYARLLPEMANQGADPIKALRARLEALQTDIELRIQDVWYREGRLTNTPDLTPTLDTFCAMDMVELCELSASTPADTEAPETGLTRLKGKILKRWRRLRTKIAGGQTRWSTMSHTIDRRVVWDLSTLFRHHAIPWLYLAAIRQGAPDAPIRLASHDIYTLWITLALSRMCGWRFQVDDPSATLDLSRWTQLDLVTPTSPPPAMRVSLARGQLTMETVR